MGKKIDVFIGIGGGSALDMAKGLSVLYTNLKKQFLIEVLKNLLILFFQ